jgi:hypothetical protein
MNSHEKEISTKTSLYMEIGTTAQDVSFTIMPAKKLALALFK